MDSLVKRPSEIEEQKSESYQVIARVNTEVDFNDPIFTKRETWQRSMLSSIQPRKKEKAKDISSSNKENNRPSLGGSGILTNESHLIRKSFNMPQVEKNPFK